MSKLKGSTYKNKDIIYIRKKQTNKRKQGPQHSIFLSETQPAMKSEAKQTPDAPFYLSYTYVQLSV